MTACTCNHYDDLTNTYLGLKFVAFEFFQQVGLHFYFLSLFVALYSYELLLTVAEVNQVTRELHLALEFSPDFILELLKLEHVFFLLKLDGDILTFSFSRDKYAVAS